MSINTTRICLLRENTLNGNLAVQFVPIPNPLEQAWKEFEPLFKSAIKGPELFKKIAEHQELKVIFNNVNYCRYMNAPEGNLHYGLEGIKTYYEHQPNSVLESYTKERITAYCLSLKQNELKQDPAILAISHRRMGWEYPVHKLNDNFTVFFKTNFGYGNSSYFYTIIQYKGVLVVPYSDWVKYRFVNKYEIIRYSAHHFVSNESWEWAMEYAKDAWNLANLSESAFVNRYLLGQCEEMVSGLASILSGNKFKVFTKSWGILAGPSQVKEEIQLSGHGLMIYRAEKISGALTFIESINALSGTVAIGGIIEKIESFNLRMRPILEAEIPKIEENIFRETAAMKSRKQEYDIASEEKNTYVARYRELREEFPDEGLADLDQRFDQAYPGYMNAMKKCDDAYKQYCDASDKLSESERVVGELKKSLNDIRVYFDRKAEITGDLVG
ncbi:hypothetical protein [Pedobacter soli]|uniref:Uncharacterized protein n=1 Tax=Pedobacter soli TaxID=390242 RepID=A0A1G7AUZ3_9SPHI|nr:hypothetical protein [Pedobacter soli]SDE17815.1 hypothetical protein SAMN04488024_11340 [Pedobacter soli]